MNKTFIFCACASVALAACSQMEPVKSDSNQSESLMKIEINTQELLGTRASAPTGDDLISNWNVFVFNGESLIAGRLDISGSANSCNLKVKQADLLSIYVVANLGETAPLAAIKNLTEFTTATSRLVNENNSLFTMVGRKDVTAKTSTTSASISLHRLVSRIQVEEVAVDFSDNIGLVGQSINDISIYIKNAPTVATMAMTSDGQSFIANGTSKADGSNWSEVAVSQISGILGDLTCGNIHDGNILDGGVHYFHCYQNKFTTAPAKGQAVRLVVKGTLLGKQQFWAFDLNTSGYGYTTGDYGITSNTIYKVRLKIKNFGSENADTDAAYTSLSGSISVEPWTTNDLGTVEY